MTALALDARFCHCCTAPVARAPVELWNRPGLSTIDYRIGSYATFRAALLEDIAGQTELAGLTTRESDDYAITLLELFAAVGDVLTFYNERIANELFLRTARERDSVLRLVRLIGYRLNPGLAATALLAFTLDDRALTRIRRGLKVMSIPGQDERPQTFETIEAILADARLNALPVYAPPAAMNAFAQGNTSAPIIARPDPLNQGDRILLFGLATIEEKTVLRIEPARDGARMTFSPAVQAPGLSPATARAVKFVRRLRFFGHNAPEQYQAYSTDTTIPPVHRWKTVQAGDPGYSMNFISTATEYPLDARYEDLKAGAQVLVDAGPTSNPRLRSAVVTATREAPAILGQIPHTAPHLQETVTHVGLRQTIRGRPAAVPLIEWTLVRSGTGEVLVHEQSINRWTTLNLLSAHDPAVVVTSDPNLEMFATDAAGGLQQNTLIGNLLIFTGWQDRSDGLVLGSRPVPLLLSGGFLVVFARGSAGQLWVRSIHPTLGAWISLAGNPTSAPAAVSWGGTRIDVFVRGADRELWRRSRNGGAWGDWETLGGTLATPPAAASTTTNRLDVVALDDEGALVHRRWNGSAWSNWLNLGGTAQEDPVIVKTGGDRVDVFVRGTDDQLWHIARNGVNWDDWEPLGGVLASAPTVQIHAGTLHVHARDADGSLVTRSWTAGTWSVWQTLGDGIGEIPDRRDTRIFEIAAPDIEFREYDYPQALTGGQLVARLADAPGLEGVDKGRRVLIDDGARQHPATVTSSRTIASSLGGVHDHLLIDFDPPVPRPARNATLQGNIAKASHGETQPEEPLGNGDATKAFQKFRLRRSLLTYLQTGTKIEGTPELELRIHGELWHPTPSLYGRKATERIYTARQADEGETVLTFGDGRTGARVPTGAMNVVARYRTGLGLSGRVRADQLAIALERPVGLRSVTNPLPADGGADPETRDDARAAAPATVHTFGRAVSLRDFEWLAMTSGLVDQAKATWVWQKLEKTVHLTVAGVAGTPLSDDALGTLRSALRAARDPNRPLMLANLVRVPIVVRAKLLRDAAFDVDAVLDAARTALLDYFAFARQMPGRAVHASEVYAALQGARGVLGADVDLLHLKGHEDLTVVERDVRAVNSAAVQSHIRIFVARPTPSDLSLIDRYALAGLPGVELPPVLAAEQAYLEDPVADVDLMVVESF